MAIKILLDAGHYKGYNRSNAFKLYYEGDMTFQLQGYLKKELEAYGFEVGVTRTRTTQDISVYNRGFMAKGYDLFLSLHSNACGTPSVDRVVVITGIDNVDDKLAKALAISIHDTMQPEQKYQIYKKAKASGGEYYGVLRGARAAGVDNRFILEHSFHTNAKMATWLYSDANLKKLAKAEAKAIAKHFGYSKPTTANAYTQGIYRVETDTLNIRKGPGTDYDKVGELQKGDAYTITEVKGSWGYLGKTEAGWICISSSYCTKVK